MPGKLRRKHKRNKPVSEAAMPGSPTDKSEWADNAPNHIVVSSGGKLPYRLRWQRLGPKKKKAILVGLALVLIGAAVGVLVYRDRSPETPVADGCSAEVLSRAAAEFDAPEKAVLRTITDEIKQLPKYDQDPNCLYVIVTYYIQTSDAAPAKEWLDKLEQVYSPNNDYHVALAARARPPAELRPTVNFLLQEAERFKKIGPTGGVAP